MPAPPDLLEPLRRGEPRALGRAISWMENGHPGARDLMASLWPHLGRATVIGITGSPGAGKSTLTDQLASTDQGRSAVGEELAGASTVSAFQDFSPTTTGKPESSTRLKAGGGLVFR